MSPMPNFSDEDNTPQSTPFKNCKTYNSKLENCNGTKQTNHDKVEDVSVLTNELDNSHRKEEIVVNGESILENLPIQDIKEGNCSENTEIGIEIRENENMPLKKQNSLENKKTMNRENSNETPSENILHTNLIHLAQLKNEICGFPLSIFKQGYLCLPYLSLPYMDLLIDINVRGYLLGATNVLFKQKRQLYDILVDFDGNRIECQDPDLRKQLHLTTEDLRFADYIVKHVSDEKHDVFLDGVGWEGGDEWIRTQFKIYLLCLMRTSLLQGLFLL